MLAYFSGYFRINRCLYIGCEVLVPSVLFVIVAFS